MNAYMMVFELLVRSFSKISLCIPPYKKSAHPKDVH